MKVPPLLRPVAAGDEEPRCRGCGYGIATERLPAACPMCRASSWEPITRHPWSELDPDR